MSKNKKIQNRGLNIKQLNNQHTMEYKNHEKSITLEKGGSRIFTEN
jgi:hypothetical protein